MKALFLFLALLACAIAEPPTQDELKNIKTVDLYDLADNSDPHVGKIVKVRFTARESGIEKAPDGRWKGSIRQWKESRGGSKYRSGYGSVTFEEAGLAWFRRLPASFSEDKTTIVFARVTKPTEFSGVLIELLGREAKVTSKGVELVW